MLKRIFMLYSISCLVMSVCDEAPGAFKYQAVVRDAAGNIIADKRISVEVKVLKSSASGAAVYLETHIVNTNLFGLINLEIGRGNAVNGSLESIDWSSTTYFIEISLDLTGGTN